MSCSEPRPQPKSDGECGHGELFKTDITDLKKNGSQLILNMLQV